jgi:hypothetical protein
MKERSGAERADPLGDHVCLCLGKNEKSYVLLEIRREAWAKLPSEVVSARRGREKDRPKILSRDLGHFTCTFEAVGSGVQVPFSVGIKRVFCWLWWERWEAVGVKFVPGRKEIGW